MELLNQSVRSLLIIVVILFGNQIIVINVSGILNDAVNSTNFTDNVNSTQLSSTANEEATTNQSSTTSEDISTTSSSAVTSFDRILTTTLIMTNGYSNITTSDSNSTTESSTTENSTTGSSTTESSTTGSNTTESSTTESSTIFPTSSTTISTTTKILCDTTIHGVNVTSIHSTQVLMDLNMTTDESCYPLIAGINCTDHYEMAFKYTKALNNPTDNLVMGNLSEFTNYTCTITVEGELNNLYNVSFRTAEGVPGTPINLRVILLNSTIFRITWSEPQNVTAIIDGYNVTIKRVEVNSENHFIRNCSLMPAPVHNNYTNDLIYDFLGEPDFVYIATVSAWSLTTKNGSFAAINVTTRAEASEVPHKVIQSLIEQNGMNNIKRSLNISWEMPCNTNGPVEKFVIELTGKYNGDIFTNPIYYVNVSASTENENYNFIIELEAASSYTLKLYMPFKDSLHENKYIDDFVTGDNYPSAPKVILFRTFARNFTVNWDEPDNKPGNITGYRVHVYYKQINWQQTNACQLETDLNVTRYLSSDAHSFIVENVLPATTYAIEIFAETSIGFGNSTEKSVTSLSSQPEIPNMTYTIENHNSMQKDSYDVNGRVTYESGCLNGKFESYTVSYTGNRSGYVDHTDFEEILDFNVSSYVFALKPARFYSVNVTIKNSEDFTSRKSIQFMSPVGVPTFDEETLSNIQIVTHTTAAVVSLKKEYFSNSNGNLDYLAIIVSSENTTGGTITNWTYNSQWPTPEKLTEALHYQVTPKFWNPFKEKTFVNYSIGDNQMMCSEDEQICNKALDPGRTYFVYLRMFNAQYYRTSMPFTIETEPTKKVGLIVGIIFGLFGVSAMGFVGFILWRRGYFNKFLKKEDPEPKTEFSKERFVEYCNYLEQNPDVFNAQWTDLQIKSEEIYEGLHTHFALLNENRRKNRYTNILPFDHSRVKLNIDEDDEICSDYINASYIKGFSNRYEYIATQGPLPHTVRDFWKMVFQENVTIIIMVAKFIENKKEKCYKYFPNNNETMLFGDDIEVKCCSELHFQIYCVRTLQVRKDLKQMTVTHMQFLEWPDHGVPIGTDNLLLFCHQMRNRWAFEGGMAVVHCSAGVGRTGTIIATDILIRAIEAGKKLDVFNTVLDLRRQRKLMVQTEKQFMYIHQLIRNIIEDPIADDEEDNQEHIYQNIKLANEKFVRAGSDVVESSF
ncbi:unnamed protein product [Ceutorhynchus assimilis]|uniref:protein-tyrosine-phosphatase n=1 Tax=Ceutorhynchus assimilis TaxID=467358 RepID=A0A9P0DE26_9CUCU|nr:unnamed protein product [Ceutorhynchus assimilis]